VGIFVLLEAVFKLFDSFVLGGVLLARKRILNEKSEIPLGKNRPTRGTDRRGRTTRRSVRPGMHDERLFVLLFPESYDFDLAAPLNRHGLYIDIFYLRWYSFISSTTASPSYQLK
jgi:hypothetical protein